MTRPTILMILGIGCLTVAVLLVGYALMSLSRGQPAAREFRVPGTFDVTAVEAGTYYLWDCSRTVFDGETVARARELPDGFGVIVRDGNGVELPFEPNRSKAYSVGSHRMTSVGSVDVAASETLTIEVSVPAGEPFRVVSFARASFGDVVYQSVRPFLFAAFFGFAGCLLGFVGFVLRLRVARHGREAT